MDTRPRHQRQCDSRSSTTTGKSKAFVVMFAFAAAWMPTGAVAGDLEDRSARFLEWVQEVEAYFDAHPELKTTGTGYYPFQRIKWAEEQRMLNGLLPPPGARWDAVQAKRERSGGPRSASSAWLELTPGGAIAGNSCPGHAIGGRMLDVEFNPTFNPGQPGEDIVYAAAAGGGVWKSTDLGVSWTPITEDIPAMPIGGVAVSRADAGILVIGTGEGTWVEGFFYSGVGVLRSTNGGGAWGTTLLNGQPWPGQPAGLGFHFVEAGPIGAATTFLAGATDGLYRSTNSGLNWVQVGVSGHFYDAKWKPGSTSVVYACVGNAASGNGVYKSTNGGATWLYADDPNSPNNQPASNTIGKTKLAVSANQPEWLYALFAEPGLGLGDPSQGDNGDLYLSTDAGMTWTLKRDNVPLGGQLSYNLCLVADPAAAQILLAGGVTVGRSTNGGSTWSPITGPSTCFKDHHAVAYEPGSSNNAWIGNDIGMFRSTSGGTSWVGKNTGLRALQFYDAAVNNGPGEPWVVGGAQDNGLFQWRNSAMTWQGVSNPPDGTICAVDGSDGRTAYAGIRPNNWMHRSTNGGDSWTVLTGLSGTPFFNALAVDATDPIFGTVYRRFLGTPPGLPLRKSENRGQTWTDVSSTVPVWISISPIDGDYVWWVYGDAQSPGVEYTKDNGTNLLQAAAFGFLTGIPTKILADPADSAGAFVTFSGYGGVAHVARTTNFGASWTNVTGDLLLEPVNGIAVNPSKPTQWFVGTDSGVWVTTNGGVNWTPYGSQIPDAYVYDVEVQNARQRLVAATHGRGVWDVDIIDAGASVVWADSVYLDADFCVPAGATLTIKPGTKVFARANSDRANCGIDPGRVEIVNQGTVLAEGTSSNPIVCSTYDGSGAAGEWYGWRFDLAGAADPAYGYVGCTQPVSSIKYATIDNAQVGIAIENLCAPTIENVTFTDIASDPTAGVPIHIYLKNSDVALPYGWWNGPPPTAPFVIAPVTWDLEAPMNVVATNASGRDHPTSGYGHAGKVDLFSDGRIKTHDDVYVATHDYVVFRPVTQSSDFGDGWGGIEVHSQVTPPEAKGTTFRFADIGYAVDPLFFAWPEICVVRESKVHHYANHGIGAIGGGANGLTIQESQVLRGAALNADKGVWGIYAEEVPALRILKTKIYDFDHVNGGWEKSAVQGGGIRIVNNSIFCQTTLSTPDSVVVRENTLVGPGEDYSAFERNGLQLDWACGTSNREVVVEKNAVVQWFHGLEMDENRDTYVQCNRFGDNRVGLAFYRGGASPDPEVRLKTNVDSSAFFQTVLVEEGMEFLALGSATSTSDRGLNKIAVDSENRYYVTQNDATFTTQYLHAEQNHWFDGAVEQTEASIIAQCEPTTGPNRDRIQADSPILTNPYNIACVPATPPLSPPAGTVLAGRTEAAPEAGGEPTWVQDSGVPERSGLAGVTPNPGRGETVIRFGVGRVEEAAVRISVYDVSGRRITNLLEAMLEPGWHEVSWSGLDGGRSRVAAGIYFVRFEAGGVRETRKIVHLR